MFIIVQLPRYSIYVFQIAVNDYKVATVVDGIMNAC